MPFGKGDIEEQQILQEVKDFIDRFADSRFSCVLRGEEGRASPYIQLLAHKN